MRVYSLSELFLMTRCQLFALHAQVVAALAGIMPGTAEHADALTNLRNIRRTLALPRNAPG